MTDGMLSSTHSQLRAEHHQENQSKDLKKRRKEAACPHLDPGLGQAEPLAQLLPHERVRIVRLVEEPLQLVELLQGEVGATPALLQFALSVLVLRLHVLLLLFALVYSCGHQARAGGDGSSFPHLHTDMGAWT